MRIEKRLKLFDNSQAGLERRSYAFAVERHACRQASLQRMPRANAQKNGRDDATSPTTGGRLE